MRKLIDLSYNPLSVSECAIFSSGKEAQTPHIGENLQVCADEVRTEKAYVRTPEWGYRTGLLALLALLLALTGCMADIPAPIVGTPRGRFSGGSPQDAEENYIPEEKSPVPFAVLHSARNANRAMYEPSEGAYLGAWLNPELPLREFEAEAGKHAVYVHEMRLGEDVPVNWLLHCIAALATPLFVIHPPHEPAEAAEDAIHASEWVVYLAQRLGAFNLPMFIAFYPPGHGMTPAEYTWMFRYARNVFTAFAPLAAFVWVAPSPAATPQNPFYPGHDAVDWVGLSLLADWGSDNELDNILASFEPFYIAFQAYKPVMLLPLGISHFSQSGYTYHIREAAAEIQRVYGALRGFPRLGLVVYADGLLSPSAPAERPALNVFSVSGEAALLEAYRNITSCGFFLSALQQDTPASVRLTRSAFHGYHWEGRTYIDIRTLENELALHNHRLSVEINGRTYVDSRRLEQKITVCTDRRVIFID